MSRPIRQEYPGALHHVTFRAQRHEERFRCADCRRAVFAALAESNGRYLTNFHAYAVMDTHVHLMVGSPDGRLPRTMQFLMASLTRRINGHHGHDGHVFKGRYFNRVVEDEGYRRHLLAYIHLNPWSAGLAPQVFDDRWTSHVAYLGAPRPTWLQVDEMLQHVGGRAAYIEYLDAVRDGRLEAPSGFEASVLIRPRCTGEYAGVDSQPPEDVDAGELLQVIESKLGEVPRGSSRGNRSTNRDVAAWALVRGGATHLDVAAVLDVSASSVSRQVQRGLESLQGDRDLAARVSELPWCALAASA